VKAYVKGLKSKLSSDKGMTLVEVLVAMSILMLIIFTFTPLFANYYRNIYTAGETTKNTYHKASLIERLLANRDSTNPGAYETKHTGVPLELYVKSSGGGTVSTITFGTENTDAGNIDGMLVTTDGDRHGGKNEYTSFYIHSSDQKMVCFPSSLTDDFIETKINVIPMGFQFEDPSLFEVRYTNQNGERVGVNDTKPYYSVELEGEGEDAYAVFTFKGANDVICFQNSPLEISYGSHTVLVEIGAPKIIMVGQQTSSGNYYYYATAGVDVTTGRLDLIAKDMKSKTDNAANLNAAMNDVEWVEKGEGDDENGNPTQYGYYVMGGDNGQIRRFWRNERTGNYYWGGDYVVNYKAYTDLDNGKSGTTATMALPAGKKGASSYSTTLKTELVTQATYESFYRSDPFGSNLIGLMQFKGFLDDYKSYVANFGSATAKTTAGIVPSFHYGGDTRKNEDSNWIQNSYHNFDFSAEYFFSDSSWTPQKSYQEMTGDMTPMPLTITSVGTVSLHAEDKSAYKSDIPQVGVATDGNHGEMTGVEAYPQSSYTLYCGTIPAYLDYFGGYFRNPGSHPKGYMATAGIGYDKTTGKYGVTGIFMDPQTPDYVTENGNVFHAVDYLNYHPENNIGGIGKGKQVSIVPEVLYSDYYQVPDDGKVGGATANRVVYVTIGYLSQPFANSTKMLQTHYTENTGSYFSNSSFNHTFFTAAPREFSTFLDMASYHDDTRDATFSVAVGYGLGILAEDARGFVRIGQMYNIGTIYIRASGDGTGDNDTVANQLEAGKGWSMKKESNVFHHFYGINAYAEGQYFDIDGNNISITGLSIGKQDSCYGWKDSYHKSGWNISTDANKRPYLQNENTHVLAMNRCTTVAIGANKNDCTEFMVGTENGTVLSWYYDYNSNQNQSNGHNKVTRAMKKEFENYSWFMDRHSILPFLSGTPQYKAGGNYDYWSQVRYKGLKSGEYSFISSLDRINDIKYGDDYWVVGGNQGEVTPVQAKQGSACLTNGGGAGSYVNVRYYADDGAPAWKSVQFSATENVNVVSVEYCQGVWYLVGYVDSNNNDVNDSNEEGVIYYAKDPSIPCNPDERITNGSYPTRTYNGGWRKCITRKADDSYAIDHTYTVYYTGGTARQFTLTGVNAAASQG